MPHDLILPIWKSNVSVTLMLEKKAKRYVLHETSAHISSLTTIDSALSLRIFGEDITVAGREEARKKSEAVVGAAPEDDAQATAVDDGRTANAEEEAMRTRE